MAIKWNDLKHKSSPEVRQRIKAAAVRELEQSEHCGMASLRTMRHQTQVAVAEQMNIPQSAVSRLERQRDCRVSTLQRYVRALGGRLEVRAIFPDDTIDLEPIVEGATLHRQ